MTGQGKAGAVERAEAVTKMSEAMRMARHPTDGRGIEMMAELTVEATEHAVAAALQRQAADLGDSLAIETIIEEVDRSLRQDLRVALGLVDGDHDLMAAVRGMREELADARKDVVAAASELLVDLSEAPPGSTVARLLTANVLMRRERDEARKASRERDGARGHTCSAHGAPCPGCSSASATTSREMSACIASAAESLYAALGRTRYPNVFDDEQALRCAVGEVATRMKASVVAEKRVDDLLHERHELLARAREAEAAYETACRALTKAVRAPMGLARSMRCRAASVVRGSVTVGEGYYDLAEKIEALPLAEGQDEAPSQPPMDSGALREAVERIARGTGMPSREELVELFLKSREKPEPDAHQLVLDVAAFISSARYEFDPRSRQKIVVFDLYRSSDDAAMDQITLIVRNISDGTNARLVAAYDRQENVKLSLRVVP